MALSACVLPEDLLKYRTCKRNLDIVSFNPQVVGSNPTGPTKANPNVRRVPRNGYPFRVFATVLLPGHWFHMPRIRSGGLILESGRDVTVHAHRERRGGMSEAVLNNLRVDTREYQGGSVGMQKMVHLNARCVGLRGNPREGMRDAVATNPNETIESLEWD